MAEGAPTLQAEFPPPHFPTVYADGVSSLANSAAVVKFYFSRTEPNILGTGGSKIQPFAQVIMPIDGFAAMFVFFERAIAHLQDQKLLTTEQLQEMRKVAQSAFVPTRAN